jgi:predicted TIM-barrel fold metal-dependent hydrolase
VRWRDVLWFVKLVGEDRVMFGSDAVADGPSHYLRNSPNVDGRETYNNGIVSLVQALGPRVARKVMGDNARRVFGFDNDCAAGRLEACSPLAGSWL